MFKLENSWKIGLSNKRDILTMYVHADSFDEAIKVVENSFFARLYGLDTGVTVKAGQKCCKHTVISHPLRFGFANGHTTIHPEGHDTVYNMMEKAINSDFVTSDIEEIYYHDYLKNGVLV